MTPLFLVLLSLLAIGHAAKPFCWEHSPDANCYYISDSCPAGLEDCSKSYLCPVSTNKCCCPKSGPPSVPPSGPTPPPTPKPKYCWEHPSNKANCYYHLEPCPWGLKDCSKTYVCPVPTNKCCCP